MVSVVMKHEPADCRLQNSSWHRRSTQRSGAWTNRYVCDVCGATRQFPANMVGSKPVRCDGIIYLEKRT